MNDKTNAFKRGTEVPIENFSKVPKNSPQNDAASGNRVEPALNAGNPNQQRQMQQHQQQRALANQQQQASHSQHVDETNAIATIGSTQLANTVELHQQQVNLFAAAAKCVNNYGDIIGAIAQNATAVAQSKDAAQSVLWFKELNTWNNHSNTTRMIDMITTVNSMKVSDTSPSASTRTIDLNSNDAKTATQYRIILKPKEDTLAITRDAYKVFDYATRSLPIQFRFEDKAMEPTFVITNQYTFSAAYNLLFGESIHENGPKITDEFEIEKRINSAYAIRTGKINQSIIYSLNWIRDAPSTSSMEVDNDPPPPEGATAAQTEGTTPKTTYKPIELEVDTAKVIRDIQQPNRGKIFSPDDIEGVEIKPARSEIAPAVTVKLSLTKECFRRFHEAGKQEKYINIAQKPYWIYEDIAIQQCNKCWKIGHYKGRCKDTKICKFCGIPTETPDTGHESGKCPNKSNPQCPTCIEAYMLTHKNEKPIPATVAHHASCVDCPLVAAERLRVFQQK